MPINENLDPPVGLARSGGTRSKTGSNYGDWSPNRPRAQPSDPAPTHVDRGYNPVGMAYKGPRDAPGQRAAVGPGGTSTAPPLVRSSVSWWDRLKSLFQADHGAPQAPRRGVEALGRARSSASDDTS